VHVVRFSVHFDGRRTDIPISVSNPREEKSEDQDERTLDDVEYAYTMYPIALSSKWATVNVYQHNADNDADNLPFFVNRRNVYWRMKKMPISDMPSVLVPSSPVASATEAISMLLQAEDHMLMRRLVSSSVFSRSWRFSDVC